MPTFRTLAACVLGGVLAVSSLLACGQTPPPEAAAIKKALAERVPQMQAVDEVSRTAMAGLFEVRVGSDLYYTDAKGDYLLQGELLDTKGQRNLTTERVGKLTAIDFASLPVKDSFTIVRGNGKRHVAVFEDPNCSYCHRFERDLQAINDVTVHVYLYPILGPDSVEKSKNLWCSKEPGRAWQDWMINNKAISEARCDTSALERNVAFGRKFRITGTPTMVFADGTRIPGAITTPEIEKLLVAASR